MAKGTASLNFGAFPGASDASIAIAETGVSNHPTSLAEAWLIPVATAEHTADEHLAESIKIIAGVCVAGVGFTVYDLTKDNTLRYGNWTIGWVWS